MNEILGDHKGVLVYLDDIQIYSESYKGMLELLNEVPKRPKAADLKIKPKRCIFGQTEIKFLGHVVTAAGISPNPTKVEAIQNCEPPTDMNGALSFLGICTHYRRFIQDFLNIVRPLNLLTHKDQPYIWGPEQQHAFQVLKDKLTSTPVLTHFDSDLDLTIETDASMDGLGAVLSV